MPSEFLLKFRSTIITLLIGILLISLGIVFYKSESLLSPSKVEILESTTSAQVSGNEITIEIAGEVIKPGVYKLPHDSRVEDLLTKSEGFTEDADKVWTDKYLNRAAKLIDGQKIYIPKLGEQSNVSSARKGIVDQSMSGVVLGQSEGLININEASASELDKLPGIGPVYAQKIVDHRPYSNIEELVSKKAISKSLFEKLKNSIAIY